MSDTRDWHTVGAGAVRDRHTTGAAVIPQNFVGLHNLA